MSTDDPLDIADYPLAEKRPDRVRGARGKTLDDITVEAVVAGTIGLDDLAITSTALRQQAEIARDAGRATLAQNFERAGEMVAIPQAVILAAYEQLRPGRCTDKATLMTLAADLRRDYGAIGLALFIEEAAAVYERRRLFAVRF